MALRNRSKMVAAPAKDVDGNPAGKGYFHNTSDDPNFKFKYKMEEKTK